jgi:hypothetical protein
MRGFNLNQIAFNALEELAFFHLFLGFSLLDGND